MGKSQSKPNHFFNDEEIKKIVQVYNKDGLDAVFPLIKGKWNNFDNEKVTIAVTGEAGVGKSAFINAMRGLGPNDEGAAEEGSTEQTSEPTPYQHPTLPSVCLWDLPGIGTTRFSACEYLNKVNFNTYDLFVLIAGERFKENDATLAKEIKKMGKEFYFVRSKMDAVEENFSKTGQRDRLEEEFDKIRRYYKNNLEESGLYTSQVFLVSSRYPDRYDFMQFCGCLESELPNNKKNVFVLSLPSLTEALIEKKKQILRAKILLAATVSAGIGAIPIPGLSFACDIGILVVTLLHMRSYLGLDDESLCRLACRVNKPVQELKAEITSPFVFNITSSSVTKLLTSTVSGAAMAADDVILLIPVIGSIIGATVSFTATSFLLNSALDDFTTSSVKVLRKATEDSSEKHYGETQKVIQQRMQSKQQEVDHLKKTIETVKTSAGNEKMEVRKLCDEWADLIHTIGLNVSTVVEKKENDVVSHAEELVKQLEAEVCELKRRNTELMELGKIEDHAHFLQLMTEFLMFTWPYVLNRTKINDAIVHNKEVEPYSETEEHLRVALIGKCGSGRSASGNTLLGREEFKSFIYNSTSTNESKKEKTQFDGTNVTVIDTPGLLDTRLPPEKVKEHLEQCIKISSPGIHAFLLVIQVGCFTIEEKKAVEEIKELYGDTVTKYMIILFTYADNLQGLTIQQYVNGANKDLRSLIELCEGRYHAFNNKNPRNRMQVIELLDKIEQMVKQNGNTCYTLEMYQHAQKAISEKDQEIKRKCEEEHKRKEEAIRKKYEDDFKIKQIEFKKLFEGIKKKEEEIKKKSEEHQEKDELLKKNRIAERKAKEELKKTEEELKVQHDEAKKKDAELKKKYEEEQRQKEEEQRKKYEEEKRKEEIISKTEEEKLEKDLKQKYDEECKRKDTDLRMKFEENNKKEEEKIEKELASKCAEEVKKREEIERAKHLIDNKKALEELKNKLKGELGDKDFEKTFEEQKKKKEEEWLANLSQLLNKNAMEIRKKYDEEKKKGKEERKKAENDRYKVFIKAHEQERKLFEEELKKKNETERRKQNDTRNKRVQEKEAVFIKQQAELRERLENEKKQKENELKQKQEKENKKREEIIGRLKAEYQKKQDETTKLQKEKQKVEEEISKLQQEKQIMEDKIK
ncbi:IIGP5 GTPase, partial [Polypterus senegalus]